MPYIKKSDRSKLDDDIDLLGDLIANAGEFNYAVSMLAKKYIEKHGECYQKYNDLMGALTGIQLELYRRNISNYEDIKIEENGDI